MSIPADAALNPYTDSVVSNCSNLPPDELPPPGPLPASEHAATPAESARQSSRANTVMIFFIENPPYMRSRAPPFLMDRMAVLPSLYTYTTAARGKLLENFKIFSK